MKIIILELALEIVIRLIRSLPHGHARLDAISGRIQALDDVLVSSPVSHHLTSIWQAFLQEDGAKEEESLTTTRSLTVPTAGENNHAEP